MIRVASSGDLESILSLYAQLHPDDPPPGDSVFRTFDTILERDGLDLIVLESDGAVVGSSYLNVIPNLTRSERPYAVIENVIVDEAHRGRGFGLQLMEGTLVLAWDAGCYKAMLMTGSKQQRTLNFYRTSGFSSEEKTAFLARPANGDF